MNTTVPVQKEERIIFSSGSAEYSVRDVIDAAHFRGELASPWRDHLRRIAAEEHAGSSGAEVERAAIDEASVAFRYEYDLITAEETERWLEARTLTLGDFSEYFVRQYWDKTFGSRASGAEIAFVEASIEQRELFATELILSGELDRLAVRLAWRVAARATLKEPPDEAALDEERQRFSQRHASDAETWLNALGRTGSWFDEMLELEAACRISSARVLTPDGFKREISSLRLPLTRLEVEMIELDSRDAASEALMCVREDGMSMEEVARDGRYPFSRREMVLEEVPIEQQQNFLSQTPGSILDPQPRDDGYVLSRLIAKHEPSIDDPQVRARIEQRLLQRHFADLTAGRIKWPIQPSIPA
ncbi:MAG: hypothetical protein M3032_08160 [Verrucomicrobiota bacterium]|nr:hypothetical protein [Verrucomicrobiota bacterium]